MEYLYNFGLDKNDIEEIKMNVDEEIFSDLFLFQNIVIENIQFLKDFGITNYSQVIVKYPEIFLRDAESFKNVFSKFDREDLIVKIQKNVAVIKKMVDFVDNN